MIITALHLIILVPLSSTGSAWTPVEAPVTMTPSDRKNSAARAVSWMLTSDVRACELQECAQLKRISIKPPKIGKYFKYQ